MKCPKCNYCKVNKFYDKQTDENIIACPKCGYMNKQKRKQNG